jgi:hypothetical protein
MFLVSLHSLPVVCVADLKDHFSIKAVLGQERDLHFKLSVPQGTPALTRA